MDSNGVSCGRLRSEATSPSAANIIESVCRTVISGVARAKEGEWAQESDSMIAMTTENSKRQ